MKALSIRQPYISLILTGEKSIELRTWKTQYRGDLLLVASKTGDPAWFHDEEEDIYYKMPVGCQYCIVELLDCRPAVPEDAEAAWCDEEDITEGLWSWVLEFKSVVKCKPCKGKLNLFEVPDEEIEITDSMESFIDDTTQWTDKEPKRGWVL